MAKSVLIKHTENSTDGERPVLMVFQGMFNDFHHAWKYKGYAALAEELDADIVVFNYPKNPGSIHGMADDTFAAAQELIKMQLPGRAITTYGDCLGGGFAVAVAAKLLQAGHKNIRTMPDRSFESAADTAQHITKFYTKLHIPKSVFSVTFGLTKWDAKLGQEFWDQIPDEHKIATYWKDDNVINPKRYLGRPAVGELEFPLSAKSDGDISHDKGIRHLMVGDTPAIDIMKNFMRSGSKEGGIPRTR